MARQQLRWLWTACFSVLFLFTISRYGLSDTPPVGFDITPFHPSLVSNVSTISWSPLRPSPLSPLPSHRYGHSSISTSSSLLVTHGYYFDHASHSATWLSDTWSFSYSLHHWSLLHPACLSSSSCPSPRFGASADLYDNHLLLYGGDDGGNSLHTPTYTYTLLSDLWRLPLSPPHVWALISTVVKPSSLLAAGFVASATLSQQSLPHAQHMAAVLQGQGTAELLVFGGMTPRPAGDREDSAGGDSVAASSQLWLLSLAGGKTPDEWRHLRCEGGPEGRFGHAMTTAAPTAHPSGGQLWTVYIHGGFRRGRGNFGDLWRLGLSTGQPEGCTWTLLAAVDAPVEGGGKAQGPTPRGYATLVAGRESLLLFAGSHCAPGCVCSQEVWAWDMRGETWAAPALLTREAPQGRYKHSGVMRRMDEEGGMEVVVFGGESYQPQKYHSDVWLLRYDHRGKQKGTARWEAFVLSPLPLGAVTLSVTGLLVLLIARHRRRQRQATKTT